MNLAEKPPLPRAFWIALAATACFALGLTSMLPILPLFITDELGAAEELIGTSTFLIAVTAAIVRIPGGALSDRYGRRSLMLIGAALGVVASVIYVISPNFAVFIVARLLSGISLALFTTTGKALVADLSPPARRGEALGFSNAAFSIAIIVSPLLGEWLKNEVGFRAVFASSGVLMAATLGITALLPGGKPARATGATASRDIKDTLHERGIWAALFIMIGMGAIMALMFSYFPLLAERKALFTDAPGMISSITIGLGLSIWALTDTLIEPIAGGLSDRTGRQVIAIPGLIVAIGGVIVMSRAHDTLSTYLAVVMLSLGWGTTRGIADVIGQDVLPPMLRGMGAAVLYTSFDLAVGIDAQVLGVLIDGSDYGQFFQTVLAMVIGFSIIGIVLATRLQSHDQRTIEAAYSD
ncbi:MAG: MFS transporter [Anaerolineae bacterium]|nr:MFS transporter [Anaerolineae bacterium]